MQAQNLDGRIFLDMLRIVTTKHKDEFHTARLLLLRCRVCPCTMALSLPPSTLHPQPSTLNSKRTPQGRCCCCVGACVVPTSEWYVG